MVKEKNKMALPEIGCSERQPLRVKEKHEYFNEKSEKTTLKQSKIILYTPDTGHPQHILKHVQLAVLLCKHRSRNQAEVRLNPTSYLRPQGLRHKVKYYFQSKYKRKNNETFLAQLEKKGFTCVEAHGVQIAIIKERPTFELWLKTMTYSILWCLKKTLSKEGMSERQGKFLSISYDNIPVGRFAAAIALRREKAAGGSLIRSKSKYFWLLDCIIICNIFANKKYELSADTYFSTIDEAYAGGLYEHLHFRQKHNVISQNTPNSNFKKVKDLFSLNKQRQVKKMHHPLTQEDVNRYHSYMKQRFEDPPKVLNYMSVGHNDVQINYDQDIDKIKNPAANNINAIIFLHAFSDAQYVFGMDGFQDIYSWTEYTIDRLLQNPNVENVLVKPHPNIDENYYKADRVAVSRLKRSFKSGKVLWLNPKVNLHLLSEIINVVGITHHGSVAEELSYLNVPVLASTHAPWGADFHFCETWTSTEEYVKKLDGVADIVKQSAEVREKQKRELIRYVVQARLPPEAPRSVFDKLFQEGLIDKSISRVRRNEMIQRIVEDHPDFDVSRLTSIEDLSVEL